MGWVVMPQPAPIKWFAITGDKYSCRFCIDLRQIP